MTSIINGKIIGVYQEGDNFSARFATDNVYCHMDIPITSEQFHALKLGVPVKIIVGFVV